MLRKSVEMNSAGTFAKNEHLVKQLIMRTKQTYGAPNQILQESVYVYRRTFITSSDH